MNRPRYQGYRQIAAALRAEFLQGPWQPGRRAPTHAALQTRFGTTRVTIQRAMDLLVEQGFIETRPKAGSYLCDRPPAACRYALAFPGHPERPKDWHWTRNYVAQYVAAETVGPALNCVIEPYFDLAARNGHLDQLEADLADHCLGGVIFAYSPHELRSTSLLRSPSVPCFFPRHDLVDERRAPVVTTEGFMDRAWDLLQERGIQTAGVLTLPVMDPEEFPAAASARGIECRPEWVQAATAYRPQWVRHSVRNLLQMPGNRPAALLICDDHLVEAAAEVIAGLDTDTTRDLLVVGQWNFPLPYDGPLPLELLGPNAEDYLRRGIEWFRDGRKTSVSISLRHVRVSPNKPGVDAPAVRAYRRIQELIREGRT